MSFHCDRAFRVQPYFDTHGSTTGDELVTLRAGDLVTRNFKTRVIHRGGKTLHETTASPTSRLALPYAHYGLVTLTVHEGSEARILDAQVNARFVAGLRKNGRSVFGACYVRRWSLALGVR